MNALDGFLVFSYVDHGPMDKVSVDLVAQVEDIIG